MLDAEHLNNQYLKWVKSRTVAKRLASGTVRIDGPFSDSYHDDLVMYVSLIPHSSSILLSDDGWSNDNLESHGLYINRSPKRKKLLLDQLSIYGVSWNDGALEISGNVEDFGHLKSNLLQAMVFVNDMFVLAPQQTQSFFFDDVDTFFQAHDIRVIKNAAFMGETGMMHNFEFSIAGNVKVPRKLIKLLSSPNNSTFAKAVFTDIYETKRQQAEPTQFYVFLNDRNRKDEPKKINPDILSLFNQITATPVLYTERERFVKDFLE